MKLENEERVIKTFTDLQAEYDEKVEKVKKYYKQTQIQMVAQLEEMAKEAASLIQQSLSRFVFVLV